MYINQKDFNKDGSGWIPAPGPRADYISDLYDATEIMREAKLACSIHYADESYAIYIPECYLSAWEMSSMKIKKRFPKRGVRFKKFIDNMIKFI